MILRVSFSTLLSANLQRSISLTRSRTNKAVSHDGGGGLHRAAAASLRRKQSPPTALYNSRYNIVKVDALRRQRRGSDFLTFPCRARELLRIRALAGLSPLFPLPSVYLRVLQKLRYCRLARPNIEKKKKKTSSIALVFYLIMFFLYRTMFNRVVSSILRSVCTWDLAKGTCVYIYIYFNRSFRAKGYIFVTFCESRQDRVKLR